MGKALTIVKPRKRFCKILYNKESDDDFLDTSSSSSSQSPPSSPSPEVSVLSPRKCNVKISSKVVIPFGQKYLQLQELNATRPSELKKVSKVPYTGSPYNLTFENKRYRPSAKVLQEIRAAYKKADHLIPKRPFLRLIGEITSQVSGLADFHYSLGLLLALQEAAENYIACLMEDSYVLSKHAKRVTLMQRDIQLAYNIGGGYLRQ